MNSECLPLVYLALITGFALGKANLRGIFNNPPKVEHRPIQRHTRQHHYKASRRGK